MDNLVYEASCLPTRSAHAGSTRGTVSLTEDPNVNHVHTQKSSVINLGYFVGQMGEDSTHSDPLRTKVPQNTYPILSTIANFEHKPQFPGGDGEGFVNPSV